MEFFHLVSLIHMAPMSLKSLKTTLCLIFISGNAVPILDAFYTYFKVPNHTDALTQQHCIESACLITFGCWIFCQARVYIYHSKYICTYIWMHVKICVRVRTIRIQFTYVRTTFPHILFHLAHYPLLEKYQAPRGLNFQATNATY